METIVTIVEEFMTFRNIIDLFQLENIFFARINYHENWFELDLNEKGTNRYLHFKNHKRYPLSELREIVHPSCHESFNHDIKQLDSLKLKERHDYQLRLVDNQFGPHWLQVILVKLEEGIAYGLCNDITEYKKSEKQLHFESQQKNFIFDNIDEVVQQFDVNGNLVYANQSFYDLFQVEPGEAFAIDAYGYDTLWFDELRKAPYNTQAVVFYEIGQRKFYLQWYNQAIIVDGELESVICLGVDITDIQKTREKIQYELNHDKNTGFLNQRGIQLVLDELRHEEYDVYYFQSTSINYVMDIYGYELANKLLEELIQSIREFKNLGYSIGHIKENEFILVNDLTRYTQKETDENLVKALNKTVMIDGLNIYLTTDIGLVSYPSDIDQTDLVIPLANLTMTQAERQRNQGVLRYQKEYYTKSRQDLEIINELRLAIDHDEISVQYQDIIDVESGEVAYVETLARWTHSQKGSVPPAQFFALADQSYLGYELDMSVIRKTLQHFKKMKKEDRYKNSILTINVTPKTFLNPNFVDHLCSISSLINVDLNRICIEVNENTFISREEECIQQINLLKQQGVVVAIDDFGRKYSSIAILSTMDFDIIKVDKVFVNSLDSEATMTILEMLIKLSSNLDTKIIIEGVETQKQSEILEKLGYQYFQGFYHSIPYSIEN